MLVKKKWLQVYTREMATVAPGGHRMHVCTKRPQVKSSVIGSM